MQLSFDDGDFAMLLHWRLTPSSLRRVEHDMSFVGVVTTFTTLRARCETCDAGRSEVVAAVIYHFISLHFDDLGFANYARCRRSLRACE